MNRPKDPSIRGKLVEQAVRYVLRHGIGGLSLRPMAKAMGTTARMLMHHFGTKEVFIAEVLLAIERGFARRSAAYLSGERAMSTTLLHMWDETAAAQMEPALRAMFEVWGQALVHPTRYPTFLASMAEPWIDLLRRRFEAAGREPPEAVVLATLAIGAFQGLQLLRLTGTGAASSRAALETLVQWLDPIPPTRRKSKRRTSE